MVAADTRALPPSDRLGIDISEKISMSADKTRRPYAMPRTKRVLIGETREEEAARLEREIAAHPVTRCEPGERGPSLSRPGWNNKPFIPEVERTAAEKIAKKMMRKP
jgi:hypothetical protein